MNLKGNIKNYWRIVANRVNILYFCITKKRDTYPEDILLIDSVNFNFVDFKLPSKDGSCYWHLKPESITLSPKIEEYIYLK